MAVKNPVIAKNQDRIKITWLGNVEVEFLLNKDYILGMGAVRVAETPLRSEKFPIRPVVSTPSGVRFGNFRLANIKTEKDEVIISAIVEGEDSGTDGRLDQYEQPVLVFHDQPVDVKGNIEWHLRYCDEKMDGESFLGFSYAYQFAIPKEHKFHHLLELGTWELGGTAEGSLIISRGQCCPPEFLGGQKDFYSTAILHYPSRRPSIQRVCRYAEMQCFDFQYRPSGIFWGYFEKPEHTLSFIQKNEGGDVYHHFNDFYFPYTNKIALPPYKVLYSSGSRTLTQARNVWTRAFDKCEDKVRKFYGIKREPPIPSFNATQDGRIKAGKEGNHQRFFQELADRYLPELAKNGFRNFFIPTFHSADYTETPTIRPGQGDVIHGNNCCPWDYAVCNWYGGKKAFRYFMKKARDYGLEIMIWVGMDLGANAPILREHPEYKVFGINYWDSPVFASGIRPLAVSWDLNSDCYEWLLAQLGKIRKDYGVDSVFIDSFGNFGILPLNYKDPLLKPQQHAAGKFISDLQKRCGYKRIETEACGSLGTPHFGVGPINPVAYQTALEWWLGNGRENYLYRTAPTVRILEFAQIMNEEVYFRLLSNMCIPGISQDVPVGKIRAPKFPKWLKKNNDLYMSVVKNMGRRTLLEDERGVIWKSPGSQKQVLFSYKSFKCDLEKSCRVIDMRTAQEVPLNGNKAFFRTKPFGVYVITPVNAKD
ncbi:MAG: hypothetical protein V2A65_02610 [Candidatus Omnitrophota bacterium]